MEKNDLHNVMAGMAKLGEIYLRISRKVLALYEKDPKLKFEARLLMAKAGYILEKPNMRDLVDDLTGLYDDPKVTPSDKILLREYGEKFYDTVLLQETADEFITGDDEKRNMLRERINQQLSIFPDPDLGCGDLVRFGYKGYDLFPVSRGIAAELISKSPITVYGIFSDGRKTVLPDAKAIYSHPGMTGIAKQEWISWYLDRDGRNEKITFTFRETKKEFRIYQWDDTDRKKDYTFMPYHMMQSMNACINVSSYKLVYESSIRQSATLDDIFEIFNLDHPDDFKGHSLSVSDVVAIKEGEIWTAYFVDSFGFQKIDHFFEPVMEREQKMLSGSEKEEELPDAKEKPAERRKEENETKEETRTKPKRIR